MNRHYTRNRGDRSVWKGALAGLAGGLIASWAMNRLQAGLSKAADAATGEQSRSEHQHGGEDATVKAAEAISESVAGHSLSKEQKQSAGPVVHYAFGSIMGAAYGAVAELLPPATIAWGLPFGTSLWLGADEIAVPALGLSKSPFDYPATTHASALAAHLVYGLTTDFTRRAIRAAW